ncbi:hypothetical protein OSB04_029806 [Centaurea solstitialis]|uniref:SWIM-type domain-containing protein n=1 Tax=Centaurea solstitialis TaxID=347529 RepID=A0AA38S777_9ASTR|nr:hypothetical protein OSB04_029806 [Centaurea solstitialis]
MDSDAVENSTLFVDEKFKFAENFDDVDSISSTDDEYDEFSTSSSSSKVDSSSYFSNNLSFVFVDQNNTGDETSSSGVEIDCVNSLQLWTPEVPDGLKPVVGQMFESLDKGIEMYKKYAVNAGFDIRLSCVKKNKLKDIILRYVVCNREGIPEPIQKNTLDSAKKKVRMTSIHRTGCGAGVKFKVCSDGKSFILYDFEEKHNHCLFDEDSKHMLKSKRKLDYSQQRFILKMSNANIGATQAHNIICQLKGGYDRVGGTKVEYKNFQRDRNCYIGDSDANLFVRKMNNRKLYIPNFSFEYNSDGGLLKYAFWADDTAKQNFQEFGDIVSFDATYRTNKYCMVFVPFTGIDNHKNCVTLGAGILDSEDGNAFKWLLKAFLKSFGKQPKLVVTDQCPAIKQAVREIFKESRHRFCMWHISEKLPAKVKHNVLSNGDFKKRFHCLIWDENIDANEFEERWTSLMTEFSLQGHKWLKYMFKNRHRWIPSFYRDIPMARLMRTTSRSESENSFFSQFFHYGATLMKFIDSFDSAMDKQRNNHRLLNHKAKTTLPKLLTPLPIEVHASKIYTRSVFKDVQNEIYQSVWSCFQSSMTLVDGSDVIVIVEKKKIQQKSTDDDTANANSYIKSIEQKVIFQTNFILLMQVTHNKEHASFHCSCLFFHHYGLLCRHIFCVFKNLGIEEIPTKYIMKRWRKDLISSELLKKQHWDGEGNQHLKELENDAQSIFDDCLGIVVNDIKKFEAFVSKMKTLKTELEEAAGCTVAQKGKEKIMESLLGVSKPDIVAVGNPKDINNKGSGTGKRLKSGKEKAIEKRQKVARLCRLCGEYAFHDSRNCPSRAEEEEEEQEEE